MVKVNLENSENIIKNIIKANQRKQFFMVLNEYITRLPLFTNEKIRDTLYNIDQFKFDALLQPEIKMRGPPSSHSNTSNSSTNSSTKSGGSLGAGTMTAANRATGMPSAGGTG